MKIRFVLFLGIISIVTMLTPSLSFGDTWVNKGSSSNPTPNTSWTYDIWSTTNDYPFSTGTSLNGNAEFNFSDGTLPCNTSAFTGQFTNATGPVSDVATVLEQRFIMQGAQTGVISGTVTASLVLYTIQSGPAAFQGITVGRGDWELNGYTGTAYLYYKGDPTSGAVTYYGGCIEGDLHGSYLYNGINGAGDILNQVAETSINGIENTSTSNIVWQNSSQFIIETSILHTNVEILYGDNAVQTTLSGCINGGVPYFETNSTQSGSYFYLPAFNVGHFLGTWQLPDSQLTGPIYSYIYVKTATTDVAPSVIGLSQAGSEKLISDLGFSVGNVTSGYSNTIPSGRIMSQSVAGGSLINLNTSIDLVVSVGPPMVSVPNVVGMTETAAESAITGTGLAVGSFNSVYSNTVQTTYIISQNPPAGTLVAGGSSVDLTTSLGPVPATMTVPNVVGLTQADAENYLSSVALLTTGTVTQAYSSTVAAGYVISQNPAAGATVATYSAVDLTISLGQAPSNVTVPDVTNMTQAAAQSTLTAAGLTVGSISQANSSTVSAGYVISQSPVAGASVTSGTAVSLTLSLGPQVTTVTVPNVVGSTQSAAQSAITSAGLVVGTVTQANSSTVPAGSVISQSPAAGASVASGTAVSLTISLCLSSNPSLGLFNTGVDNSGAVLPLGSLDPHYTMTGPESTAYVIQSYPSWVTPPSNAAWIGPSDGYAGSLLGDYHYVLTVDLTCFDITTVVIKGSVAADNTVKILLNGNDTGISTPNQNNVSPRNGQSFDRLHDFVLYRGFISGINTIDFVVSNYPYPGGEGNTPSGLLVTNLTVSQGPQTVTVPNVVDMAQADAQTAIISAGLTTGTITQAYSTTVPSGNVISQNPASGVSVAIGSSVDLVVSLGFGDTMVCKGSTSNSDSVPNPYWTYAIWTCFNNYPFSTGMPMGGDQEFNLSGGSLTCNTSAYTGYFANVIGPVTDTATVLEQRYIATGTVTGPIPGTITASCVQYTIQDGPPEFKGITIVRGDWELNGYTGTTYFYYRLDSTLGSTYFNGRVEGDIHGYYFYNGTDNSGDILNQVFLTSINGIENTGTLDIIWQNPNLYISETPVYTLMLRFFMALLKTRTPIRVV